MEYQIFNGTERPITEQVQSVVEWPEFMYHDSVSQHCWDKFLTDFAPYQFTIYDGDAIVGYANTIPLHLNAETLPLDDRGWDWALEKGVEDLRSGALVNVLCGLQIAISDAYRGKGMSRLFIEQMRCLAFEKGIKQLILPVRPTLKSNYPLVSMDAYIGWKNKEGLSFDPWIRAHEKAGAEMLGICACSMYIKGSVADWGRWTGLSFLTTGFYSVKGALSPVFADVENDVVEYKEPNVWMLHRL